MGHVLRAVHLTEVPSSKWAGSSIPYCIILEHPATASGRWEASPSMRTGTFTARRHREVSTHHWRGPASRSTPLVIIILLCLASHGAAHEPPPPRWYA